MFNFCCRFEMNRRDNKCGRALFSKIAACVRTVEYIVV